MSTDLHYEALPQQYWFLRSRAKFAGLFGGIGSGKSHVGCFWALTKALRNPHCLGLIGANSYRQLKDATLRTFEMLLNAYGIGYTFNRSTDMVFRLENGAQILCRSLDSYDLLRGVELGWFYLDELRDTRLEAWQVVKGRLRSQQVDRLEGRVTSSPNGFDWIYEEFVAKPRDPATADAYANHAAYFARTAENKHLPPDYVAALVASYDPRLARQELDGQFLNIAAGRIYHAFDRRVHVTDEAEFVPGEPLLWALDFNVTPMTAVIAQLEPLEGPHVVPPSGGSPQDRVNAGLQTGLRVVDELWLTNANTLAMCEAFGEWLAERAARCEPRATSAAAGPLSPELEARSSTLAAALRVYGDAAGSARSTSGRSDYAIIRQAFPHASLCVGAANPPRRDRYNAVNLALRDARGQVRLRIHPRCRHLVEDLERVVYQPGTNLPDTGDPLRGHIADALGYLVAKVMPAGRPTLSVGRW